MSTSSSSSPDQNQPKRWYVHEETGKLKGKSLPVYYLKYDKVFYGTTLDKDHALSLVDKYNSELTEKHHEHIPPI